MTRPCMNCLQWTCEDDGSETPSRICAACAASLADEWVHEPHGPALQVGPKKLTIPRAAVGQRMLKRAAEWKKKNGAKLLKRDKADVEAMRNRVDQQRREGKRGPLRFAAKLPGRWFAEKRLALGDAFTHDPERIRHEAQKDNLWLDKG